MIKKGEALASKDSCNLTIGSQSYSLEKVDVPSSIAQEYRLSNEALITDLTTVNTLLTGDNLSINLSLFDADDDPSDYVQYEFKRAVPSEIRSKVRAKCLIFELGTAGIVKGSGDMVGERFIGGNNYDGSHAKAGRVLGGFSKGFTDGVGVRDTEAYGINKGKLFRFSRDVSFYSNKIINLLTDPKAEEVKNIFALTGLRLKVLADESQVSNNQDDFRILSKYLDEENIDIKENPSYNAIKGYLTGDSAQSSPRLYGASLLDPTGERVKSEFSYF